VADQVVLLAPSQAFTSSAPVLVGPLSCLNRVVTDQPLPEAVAVALSRAGVVVDIADVPARGVAPAGAGLLPGRPEKAES
jgi:DeoR/GlpR family transcriptional regulator of sugar metabolism